MSTVGIIANPAAGKDIRRLISQSRFISNQEKINIVRRVLVGLGSMGVDKVILMPDQSNLARASIDDLQTDIEFSFLDMPIFNAEIDTTRAASMMEETGVKAIVSLGGDGTNRAITKGTNQIPLMPISTGTNNVFPFMIEGTLAGIATGCVAMNLVDSDTYAPRTKLLKVHGKNVHPDLALVDLAVSSERFVGARAIWDMSSVMELYLAMANPTSIGLSAIGGMLHPISRTHPNGLHLNFEGTDKNLKVLAPVTPGNLTEVSISQFEIIDPYSKYTIDHSPCTIAFDGERSMPLQQGETVEVELSLDGPLVIDPIPTLEAAAAQGVFIKSGNFPI